MNSSESNYVGEWEKNAATDPLFAILTSEHRHERRWDVDEFFATGRNEIAIIFEHLRKIGATLDLTGTFLDFGCGVGRLSRALALKFEHGYGVDISSRMIELARSYSEADASKVDYIINQKSDLQQIHTGSISFVYSHIVLQHLRQQLQPAFIREFLRVLKPGGIAAFQIPTGRLPRNWMWGHLKAAVPSVVRRRLRRLKSLLDKSYQTGVKFDMNCCDERIINKLIREANCETMDLSFSNSTETSHDGAIELFSRDEAVRRIKNNVAHSDYISAFYFVRKRQALAP
jgi:SAM-dependent methyltransferase